MELHTLHPAVGARKKSKRIGRGQGSGKGGTSTKGHKGAQSRSGYKTKPKFEGGQTPLQRRVPKSGFKKPHKVDVKVIRLERLEELAIKSASDVITSELLAQYGIIKIGQLYKILGGGNLNKKLKVFAPRFSDGAKKSIEALGGTITIAR